MLFVFVMCYLPCTAISDTPIIFCLYKFGTNVFLCVCGGGDVTAQINIHKSFLFIIMFDRIVILSSLINHFLLILIFMILSLIRHVLTSSPNDLDRQLDVCNRLLRFIFKHTYVVACILKMYIVFLVMLSGF